MTNYEKTILENPAITADGYGIICPEPSTFEERMEEVKKSRAELADYGPAFHKCLEWLETHASFNRKSNSYGLKHQVERYFRDKGESVYVPNGVFILAALSKGYSIESQVAGSPNVMFR
jgi:hypothetical protein